MEILTIFKLLLMANQLNKYVFTTADAGVTANHYYDAFLDKVYVVPEYFKGEKSIEDEHIRLSDLTFSEEGDWESNVGYGDFTFMCGLIRKEGFSATFRQRVINAFLSPIPGGHKFSYTRSTTSWHYDEEDQLFGTMITIEGSCATEIVGRAVPTIPNTLPTGITLDILRGNTFEKRIIP